MDPDAMKATAMVERGMGFATSAKPGPDAWRLRVDSAVHFAVLRFHNVMARATNEALKWPT